MSEAPERIWAWAWEVDRHGGQWSEDNEGEGVEYLRADLAAATETALRAEIDAQKRWITDLTARQTAVSMDNHLLRGLLEDARKTMLDVGSSLAAAISLLERGGKAAKKAAPSDTMFDIMLNDYRASFERARATLAKIGGTHD
jgi:hypothetical protein